MTITPHPSTQVTAHRNPALQTLDQQLKHEHPGIVIGWIADQNHDPGSDHQEDPDGTVDALDPMIGPHYSVAEAERDVNSLIRSRDKRIKYIIWQGHIISSIVQPWIWRRYDGNDPHTGHWHISTMQQYETSKTEWGIYMPSKMPTMEITGTKPYLKKGMQDEYGAVQHIHRMQRLLGIKDDGVFGTETEDALKKYLGSSYDGTVDMDAWRKILGLW